MRKKDKKTHSQKKPLLKIKPFYTKLKIIYYYIPITSSTICILDILRVNVSKKKLI